MPTKPPFQAVIFDLDGTLVDTEQLCNETGVEACANMGHVVSLQFFENLAGIDDANRVLLIGKESGRAVDEAGFLAEWDRLCTLRFAQGIPVKPGAQELIDHVLALGLPMAICTSSRRAPAAEKISAAGFDAAIQAVVTVDDVPNAKPAPDPYLLAAERLGIRPEDCLAFEDSDVGTRSARLAGMKVVQIPDLHAPKGNDAHVVAETLLDGAQKVGLLAG